MELVPDAIRRPASIFLGMVRHDFRIRYAGSCFGTFWAVVHPVATLLIFWFVFQVGFGAKAVDGVPYVLWLTTGLVPWLFFSEAWTGGTQSLTEYGYLVKKMVFHVEWLPALKIASSGFMHVVFMASTLVLLALYGMPLRWNALQVVYYGLCMNVLVWTLCRITAAVQPFFKDLAQFLAIGLQFGMWLTPILWPEGTIPAAYRWMFKANPVYYVVRGYRDALLGGTWRWERPFSAVCFWRVVMLVGLSGRLIFVRLKPHFPDVL